jgi:uncharacterized spore protein YtfJ
MSLDRVFAIVEGMRQVACADAAFGKPQEYEGKVLIPVATVSTGFGLGLGQTVGDECEQAPGESETTPEESQTPVKPKERIGEDTAREAEGGVGGGGVRSRPIAVIEITPTATVIRPIVDEGKVLLAGIALVAWIALWLSLTLQAIFGREA